MPEDTSTMNLRDRLSRGREEQTLGKKKFDPNAPPEDGKRTLSHLMTRHKVIPKQKIDGLMADFEADPTKLESAKLLAPLLYQAQDYKKAGEVYTRLLEADQKNGQYWMLLANCLARQHALAEAIQCYQRAIRLLESHEMKNKCVKRLALVEDYLRSQLRR